jgi:hypothetical protein
VLGSRHKIVDEKNSTLPEPEGVFDLVGQDHGNGSTNVKKEKDQLSE